MDKRIDLHYTEPHVALREDASDSVLAIRVPCHVCRHEIPASEALVPEATDYLVYFCGLDCYQAWLDQLNRN